MNFKRLTTVDDKQQEREPRSDGLYTIETADRITLKMLRYRPSLDASYREGAQPVLLFPGIMCNMNEFLVHTPEEKKAEYADLKIENMADWAIGDPYIEEDPLMYYNLGYYLWKQGYDPWFLNYRGTGVGPFKSKTGDWAVCLDTWAMLDVPAAIDKVKEVTGISPIIGGHSTGGLVSYAYLQGTYFENGPGSHVRSDQELAKERNSEIKGVIAIDPAGEPPLPEFLDMPIVWTMYKYPLYIDLRAVLDIEPMTTLTAIALPTSLGLFYDIIKYFGDDTISNYIGFWNARNTDSPLEYFITKYAFPDNFYTWCVGQYLDFGMHHTIREFWKNGSENKDKINPPNPAPGKDGYYYYKDNMNKVTAPFITILSSAGALINPRLMLRDLVNGKTRNPFDETYIIPDTAHIDIIYVSNVVFPKIGAWLSRICPNGPKVR